MIVVGKDVVEKKKSHLLKMKERNAVVVAILILNANVAHDATVVVLDMKWTHLVNVLIILVVVIIVAHVVLIAVLTAVVRRRLIYLKDLVIMILY